MFLIHEIGMALVYYQVTPSFNLPGQVTVTLFVYSMLVRTTTTNYRPQISPRFPSQIADSIAVQVSFAF